MAEQIDTTLRCRDLCGASAADDEAAMHAGWSYLQISGGWRCGRCAGELAAASRIVGVDGDRGDPLPPASRGALPRETATTIAPSVVKG